MIFLKKFSSVSEKELCFSSNSYFVAPHQYIATNLNPKTLVLIKTFHLILHTTIFGRKIFTTTPLVWNPAPLWNLIPFSVFMGFHSLHMFPKFSPIFLVVFEKNEFDRQTERQIDGKSISIRSSNSLYWHHTHPH